MLKVLKSGFYTTVQDRGRFGFRAYGVPVSGAMDSYSSQFANALLGNINNDAVLELTMTGPKLVFLQPTLIAISGADMSPKLNTESIEMNKAIQIKPNDILSFGKLNYGLRAYLAIKGGILSEKTLKSRSMYQLITTNYQIHDNDLLYYKSYDEFSVQHRAKVKCDFSIVEALVLEVQKGPEFSRLSKALQKQLLNTEYNVSKLNNRMAYQLEPLFENTLEQIITAPVLPGTVQLTPSGQFIVLMRDCQTTGGYPRIFQLTERSINSLSQKRERQILKFRLKN